MKKLFIILIMVIIFIAGCKKDKKPDIVPFDPENFIGTYYHLDRDEVFMVVEKYENNVFHCIKEGEKFIMKEEIHNKYRPVHKHGKLYAFEYYGEKNRVRVTHTQSDQTKIMRVEK